MVDHSHYDYESAIAKLGEDVSSLKSKTGSLQGKVTRLTSGVNSVKSQMTEVKSSLSGIQARVSSVEGQLGAIERTIEAIGTEMGRFGNTIEGIAASVREGSGALASVVENVERESAREQAHRTSLAEMLSSLGKAQAELSDALAKAFGQFVAQLDGLRSREEEFQREVTGAAETFEGIVRDLDRELQAQLKDISEDIGRLDDEERDGMERTLEVLQEIQGNSGSLGEHFSSMQVSSAALAESMRKAVQHEEETAQASGERRAVRINSSGLKLLASGQHRAAVEIFRQAVTAAPQRAEPRYNLAVALFRGGNTDEVRRLVGELVEQFPENTTIRTLGNLLLASGGPVDEATARSLKDCVAESPDAALTAAAGVAMMAAGRPREARRLTAVAARDNPRVGEIAKDIGIVIEAEVEDQSDQAPTRAG